MAGHYSRILDFVENLPAEGDAIAGYSRNGKQYKLTAADLRGLLAENERLRMQNDELFTENHEMRHGPTVSAEG